MARYVEQGGVSSHYGDFYRITRDSYGVNLSALERRQCSLDKPLERCFGSIRKWLYGKFDVNPKTHLLTVHTVTSWETNGDFWELTLISSCYRHKLTGLINGPKASWA